MKTISTKSFCLAAFIFASVACFQNTASAQTLPILPSPNHDTDHNSFINGSITVNGSPQKVAGVIAKLSRILPGQILVPVSYAISDMNGEFVLTGQAGIEYRIDYEFPTAGFTAITGNPSSNFIAAIGNAAAPDGGLELSRNPNTITNCNMKASEATDWFGQINVEKAIQLNPSAILDNITVFGSAIASHPLIDVTATTASTIRALRIGVDVSLEGPGGYSEFLESVKTFAAAPPAQNIVMSAGQTLSYYDITSARSSSQSLGSVPTEYTGTGNVVFDANAFGSKTITITGGNTSSVEETFAAAGVCITYTYNSDPLPVTLAHFNAKSESINQKSISNLNWTTTAETNSLQFDVQRSTDGKSWSKIGSVDAKRESNTITYYTFSDETPANGNNYYRLKMIDADQTFSFSSVKHVRIENNLIPLYPNPATTYFQIEPTFIGQVSEVSILNQNGNIVEKMKGTSQITEKIDLTGINPGLYFVRLKFSNGTSSTQKLAISK